MSSVRINGIRVAYSNDRAYLRVVDNGEYERIERFDPSEFIGCYKTNNLILRLIKGINSNVRILDEKRVRVGEADIFKLRDSDIEGLYNGLRFFVRVRHRISKQS